MGDWPAALMTIAVECGLFAAIVFLVMGIDDLVLDAMALAGVGRGPAHPFDPADVALPPMALLIPAWAEADVIGPMLAATTKAWPDAAQRFYVGVYPNDLGTMHGVAAAAAGDPRIRMVLNDCDGPTTKGACLNQLWQALRYDQHRGQFHADIIAIHDAEDVVDPAEPALYADVLLRADYVQLPVLPLMGEGRWIGRHYADEFAEAHGKDLPVRAAIGASVPLAGVACAFRADALLAMADAATGGPFASDSLVEDYELGLACVRAGLIGQFARRHAADGRLIAARAFFPQRLRVAVWQKTRWLRGIALDGWVRSGWPVAPGAGVMVRIASWWMLWRDRRAAVAALAVTMAYLAVVLATIGAAVGWAIGQPPVAGSSALVTLGGFNALLLVWRLAARAWFTGRLYGWRHGLMAVPRQGVANIILIMTVWRALRGHHAWLGGAALRWDKTDHAFPDLAMPAGVAVPLPIQSAG